MRPEFVPPDKWLIAAEFHPNANASVGHLLYDAAFLSNYPCLFYGFRGVRIPSGLLSATSHLVGQVDYMPADVLWQCTSKRKEVAKPDPSGEVSALPVTDLQSCLMSATAGVCQMQKCHKLCNSQAFDATLLPVAATVKEHPYLTAEEMEQQYRSVINKAVRSRRQDDTGGHFGTVRHTMAGPLVHVALLQQQARPSAQLAGMHSMQHAAACLYPSSLVLHTPPTSCKSGPVWPSAGVSAGAGCVGGAGLFVPAAGAGQRQHCPPAKGGRQGRLDRADAARQRAAGSGRLAMQRSVF